MWKPFNNKDIKYAIVYELVLINSILNEGSIFIVIKQ